MTPCGQLPYESPLRLALQFQIRYQLLLPHLGLIVPGIRQLAKFIDSGGPTPLFFRHRQYQTRPIILLGGLLRFEKKLF